MAEKPWTTLICHERALKVNDFYFSMNTTFNWREHKEKNEELIDEACLNEALYTLQKWRRNGVAYSLRCKPIVDIPMIDLVGQKRASAKYTMHFLTNELTLVNFVN